jgi:uncharacterized protein DUF6627
MKLGFRAALCRTLIVLMAWLPFDAARADMIGTGQALARPAQSDPQSDRQALARFLGREDVARELQRMGIDPAAAQSRAAALSDDEAALLAHQIESAPAGGTGTLTRIFSAGALILIVVVIVWALVNLLFKTASGAKS